MGIPIPETIVIWASPSHISLAIWVRVKATGDAPHMDALLGKACTKYRLPEVPDDGRDLAKRTKNEQTNGQPWGKLVRRRERFSPVPLSAISLQSCRLTEKGLLKVFTK